VWQVIWFLIFSKFVVYGTLDAFIYDGKMINYWNYVWGLTLINNKTKNKKNCLKIFLQIFNKNVNFSKNIIQKVNWVSI